MLHHLDFDYLIISNQLFDRISLKSEFDFFSSLGIKKFIFTYEANLSTHSLPKLRQTMRVLQSKMNDLRPRGVRVKIVPELYLSKDAVRHSKIPSLCADHSDRIFVRLPWFEAPSWLEENLNYLIYKQHCFPVFISFESNICTTPDPLIRRLLHAYGLSFALDLNHLTSVSDKNILPHALDQKLSVYPAISHDRSCYSGILNAMSQLKNRIGEYQYIEFCRLLHLNGLRLF